MPFENLNLPSHKTVNNGESYTKMNRRVFTATAMAGAFALYKFWADGEAAEAAELKGPFKKVKIAQFDASGKALGVVEMEKVVKSEAEWKKQLTPSSFNITRKKDTEYAGTGKYDHFYEDGIYHCICCDTALFDSKTKFNSGTGWPSFYKPIAKENVTNAVDTSFGSRRTENMCTRCDAHLGHVFEDGPPAHGPTLLHEFGFFEFRASRQVGIFGIVA